MKVSLVAVAYLGSYGVQGSQYGGGPGYNPYGGYYPQQQQGGQQHGQQPYQQQGQQGYGQQPQGMNPYANYYNMPQKQQAKPEEQQSAPPSQETEEQEESNELPPGWMEIIDPSSGRPYYYNQLDGTTTWKKPDPVPKTTVVESEVEGNVLSDKEEREMQGVGDGQQQEYQQEEQISGVEEGMDIKADEEPVHDQEKDSEYPVQDQQYWEQQQRQSEESVELSPEDNEEVKGEPVPEQPVETEENQSNYESGWGRSQQPQQQGGWGTPPQGQNSTLPFGQYGQAQNEKREHVQSDIQQDYPMRPQPNAYGYGVQQQRPVPQRDQGRPQQYPPQQGVLRENQPSFPSQQHQQQQHQQEKAGSPWKFGQRGPQQQPPPQEQQEKWKFGQQQEKTDPPKFGHQPPQQQSPQQQQNVQQAGSQFQQQPPQQRGPQQSGGYGGQYQQGPPQQRAYPQQQQPPLQPGSQYQQGPPQQGGWQQSHQQGQQGYYGQYNQYGQYDQYRPDGQGGQLVEHQQSSAIKEALGSAWQGVLGFGSKAKETAAAAKDTVVSKAQSTGQTIGTTSAGFWSRAKTSVEGMSKSLFESSPDQQQGGQDGYSLSQYGVPPAPGYPGQYPPQAGQQQYPPQYQQQGYPQQQQSPPQQQGRGYPQPRGSVPYPHQGQGPQGKRQGPPGQAQWRPSQQQRGSNPYQQRQSPQQQPPHGQYPPQGQGQQRRPDPAQHPGWSGY